MMRGQHPPRLLQAHAQSSAQRGIVLLTVLVMLAIASAWTTYAWRQVFWQQRMLHSQGLEQMAWQAAEAGGLEVRHRMGVHIGLNPGLHITAGLPAINTPQPLPGVPSSHWQISAIHTLVSTKPHTQAIRMAISGQIHDPQHSGQQIAQAQLLLDIESTTTGLHITRWQRVYPR